LPDLIRQSINRRYKTPCAFDSALATVAAFLMAGVWGAGNSIIPLAAGAARGSAFQETAIAVVAYSAAPTGITSFALILWGLRLAPSLAEE
jgi:hydroxylaminobenzene mutase